MVTFCSITSPATLPQARVLALALRRLHPDARLLTLLIGNPSLGATEPFETLPVAELADSELLGGITAVRTITDALRPRLLGRALADGADLGVYLDPTVNVYAALDDALPPATVVLSRRLDQLPEDGERPNYADLLLAGRVSPAFVAVRAGPQAGRFLEWWSQRVAVPGEHSARWLDLALDLFPEAATLDDPGCNVSYWNLHERRLERRGEQLLVSERPLRWMDFAGFRPDRPYWLSDAATRISVLDDPVLAEVCGEYAEGVLEAGWSGPRVFLESASRLGNGMPMDELVRGLWAEAVAAGKDFGSPSSPLAADRFTAWMREPAEQGGDGGVNRYLLAAYRRRRDLQQVFPDLDGPDAPSLIAWAWDYGRRELQLAPELLPALPDSETPGSPAQVAVNVVGYLRDTLGLAEAARLYIKTLAAAEIPVSTTAVAPDLPVDPRGGRTIRRYGHHPYDEQRATVEPSFNLVCVNGDQLAALVRVLGPEILEGRPTIGQWAWETDVLPPSWLEGFRYVDEIWVNSTFVAENLGRLSPVPVVVIPQGITVPEIDGVTPELARDQRFTFLFMLDLFSTLRRKNADGLIDAFSRAFRPGEGPRLLLKTINAQFRREAYDELRYRIGDRPDIDLADGFLDAREKTALIARADCYVSLHRSEGFGLTLAESMALGTPVIATGYSGNMDFTTPENSYLVDSSPARVGPDCDVYPPEGTWANPDLDHAAALMRRVWEAPAEAQEKAGRARADIERRYAPSVTGRIARERLERLLDARSGFARRREPGGALTAVERELGLDILRGSPARGGMGGLVRKTILRAMLPFTVHERNLDRALRDAVRELRTDLERERARGARLRARVRRVEDAVGGRDGEP